MATQQYLDYAGLQTLVTYMKNYAGNLTGKTDASGNKYASVMAYLEDQIKEAAKAGQAANVSVADADNHFTSDNVEGALAELAVAIATLNGGDTEAGSVAKAIKDAIGDLGDYTTVKAYVDAMVVAVKKIISNEQGTLTDLTTTNKSTLVAAINEIDAAVKAVDYGGKADKVASAVAGNLAGLDADGNLVDSGKKAADFEVAGAAQAVSGYASDETAKTVKQVEAIANANTTAIGAKATETTEASGLFKYVDDAVAAVDSTTANKLTVKTDETTSGALKTYKFYQGGEDAANLVTTIDIPKDFLVKSGSVVENPEGKEPGKYIALVINTVGNDATNDTIYINVADLVDVYTAKQNATQIQLDISNTNEISATIVAKSVTATELADAVNTEIAKGGQALTKIGKDYKIGETEVDVKKYIDSRIFVGTQAEVDAKKTAGEIDDTTFTVIVDDEADGIESIPNDDIIALFA